MEKGEGKKATIQRGSQCCAFGCSKRRKCVAESQRSCSEGSSDEESAMKRKHSRTFHRFPSNEERRKEWVKNVHRANWSPSRHSLICSDHFKECCMDRTGQTVRVRDGAVPTRFKKFPPHLKIKIAKEYPSGFSSVGCGRCEMQNKTFALESQNNRHTGECVVDATPLHGNPYHLLPSALFDHDYFAHSKSEDTPQVLAAQSSNFSLQTTVPVHPSEVADVNTILHLYNHSRVSPLMDHDYSSCRIPNNVHHDLDTSNATTMSLETARPAHLHNKNSSLLSKASGWYPVKTIEQKLNMELDKSRERILTLTKKLKSCQQRNRRLTRRVASLKKTAKELKQQNELLSKQINNVQIFSITI